MPLRVGLGARVAILDAGASASVRAAWCPRQWLGFFAGFRGERGVLYVDSRTARTRFTWEAGLSGWVTKAVNLNAGYSLELLLPAQFSHEISLSLAFRI